MVHLQRKDLLSPNHCLWATAQNLDSSYWSFPETPTMRALSCMMKNKWNVESKFQIIEFIGSTFTMTFMEVTIWNAMRGNDTCSMIPLLDFSTKSQRSYKKNPMIQYPSRQSCEIYKRGYSPRMQLIPWRIDWHYRIPQLPEGMHPSRGQLSISEDYCDLRVRWVRDIASKSHLHVDCRMLGHWMV